MASTYETLKDIISNHVGVAPEVVTLDAYLVDDIGMDSLDEIEVLVAVEEAFSIWVDEDKLDDVETVSDAVKLIDATKSMPAV